MSPHGFLPVLKLVSASEMRLQRFATEATKGISDVANFATAVNGREAIMKMTKLAMLIATIAVAMFILIPNLSWAEDGASLYKAKCAACHGADGAGRPAAKIPSLTSDEAKKMSDADLEKAISEKPKHAGMAKSLTPDQVKMIATYVKSMQK